MHRSSTVVVAGLAAAALLAGGCGSSSNKSSSSSSASGGSSQSAGAPKRASVSFVSPTNGATVSNPVHVRVKLSHFQLDPADVGKKAMPGKGHLHFSMDDGRYDQPKYSGANGKLAVKLGVNGKYSPSVTPTITYKKLPKGKHALEVYLANNDHTNTGVETKTTFTVK